MPENPPVTPDPGPVSGDSAPPTPPAAPDPTPPEAVLPRMRSAPHLPAEPAVATAAAPSLPGTASTVPAAAPGSPGSASTSSEAAPDIVVAAPGWPAPPFVSSPHPPVPENPVGRPKYAPPQPIPSRSARAPLPGGLLAAVGAAGLAAAILVPVDRPGVGWLLAGLAVAGTVYGVDRAARRAADRDSVGAKATTRTDQPGSRGPGADASTGVAASSVAAGAIRRGGLGGAAQSTRDRRSAVADRGSVVDSPASARTSGGEASVGQPVEVTGTAPVTGTSRGWPDRAGWERISWAVLALALLGVGAFRDAPWLFGLCVVGAVLSTSLAVVPRSVYGLWFDVLSVPFAGMTSLPWLFRAARETRGRATVGSQRVWWSVAVAAALLVVMVPLLAGADAVFAGMVNGLVPSIDVPAVLRWGLVFVVVGMGTAGMLYLLAAPPPAATDGRDRSAGGSGAEGSDVPGRLGIRRFSPVEWGIPVGALTIVFAAFVATQVAVLFGGDGYVQRTAGLTYAEYARSGFWQLSIVSLLTLAVIAGVLRCARRESAGERRWLRGAIAVVCGLTLLIVASALHRMWTYQQAYGFTVLRLLVEVFEGWIALVYLLVLVSLISLRRGWVPRAAIGAAAVTLLGLAVLNPEGLIADRNIDRWQAGKNLDTSYLSGLSADALPATDRLPDPQRAAIAEVIRARLDHDSWQGWNYARATARR